MRQMTRRELLDLLLASGVVVATGCQKQPSATGPSGETDASQETEVPGEVEVPGDTDAASVPVAYLRTNWSNDPYAFGSYSYVSKDSPGTGEDDRATVEAAKGGAEIFIASASVPPLS